MRPIQLKKLLNPALLEKLTGFLKKEDTLWITDAQGEVIFSQPKNKSKENLKEISEAIKQTKEKVILKDKVGQPVIALEKILGMVIAQSSSKSSENPESLVAFLTEISKELLLKEISKKEVITDALEKYREINLLYRISERLSSCLEVYEICKLILEESLRITKAQAGFILFTDKENKTLTLQEIRGLELTKEKILEILTPFALSALKQKQPGESLSEVINNISQDPRNQSDQKYLKCLVYSLLKTTEETLGIIFLANKEGTSFFSAEDMNLLASIASQAAIAISHANLIRKLIQSERLSTVGRLTNTIIHDIKNPLFIIRSFAEFLAKPNLQEDKRSFYLKIITSEMERLMNMTAETLEYSKGELNLNLQECTLKDIVLDTCALLEQDFKTKNIELKLDLAYEGSLKLDVEKMKRVLFNIAGNAKDAMEENGTFELKIKATGQELETVLSDTGKGMPPEVQKKIFEPFYTTGKEHGTGLGMPIVKRIVEAHRGTISFTSEVGKGTSFLIKLPLKS